MAVKPYFGKNRAGPAWAAGLRPKHVIVAVNGERPAVDGRAFMVWLRLHFEPGDEVELEVRTLDGETGKIRYRL